MSIDEIIGLVIEGWKLSRLTPQDKRDRVVINRFLNKFNIFLKNNGVEIVDLTGQVFDSGMAVEVIYTEDENKDNALNSVIVETIRPLIFINGKIAKVGQVVIKKM